MSDKGLLELDPISILSKDIRKSARLLTPSQARYLVDLYYQIQNNRIRAANQVREQPQEPTAIVTWVFDNMKVVESNIKKALDEFSEAWPEGQWAKSQVGIGPVIAAGLLAHIDVSIATNPSKLWRFAGLDPTLHWERKTKRPWNARLKVIAWKFADSVKKHSGKDECFYGKLYRQFKEREVERNESGRYAIQAGLALAEKNFKRDTQAKTIYQSGKLPPGHLDARAMRLTSKVFLAHYHHVATVCRTGKPPARPWILTIGGHSDYIPIPNWKE